MLERRPKSPPRRAARIGRSRILGLLAAFLCAVALWPGSSVPSAKAGSQSVPGVAAPDGPLHKQLRVEGTPPALAMPRRIPATSCPGFDDPSSVLDQPEPQAAAPKCDGAGNVARTAEPTGRTGRYAPPRGPPSADAQVGNAA